MYWFSETDGNPQDNLRFAAVNFGPILANFLRAKRHMFTNYREESAMSAIPVEIEDLKDRLKATWSSGDYGVVARNLETSAEQFLARISITPGSRLLDAACGTGQIAFPAFTAGAHVTGIDIVPDLIEQARARAAQEKKAIRFDVGDVEDLPYQDDEFDLVVSLIGAMFAPRPRIATAELARVTRTGGRIVMGNWTPEGFIGHMFKVVSRYVPPPPMESPLNWGQEQVVRERFADYARDIQCTQRLYPFYYPFSATEVVNFYREYFGPIHRAFKALDRAGQEGLHRDLTQLWTDHNTLGENETAVDAGILEVVVTL